MLARTAANLPTTDLFVVDSRSPDGTLSAATTVSGSEPKMTERDRLLCALVRRYLLLASTSPAEWNKHESALLLLADSILGSSMAPAAVIANEEAVVETIKKRLARTGPEGIERAVRFSDHLLELQRLVPSRRLWSMLYFLLRVAEKSGKGGGSSGRIAEILGGPLPAQAIIYTPPSLETEHPTKMQFADKPMAEYWKQFQDIRQRSTRVPETALLRDLAYVLRGSEGVMIKFSQHSNGFALLPSVSVSLPTRHMVDRIARVGTGCHSILRLASYNGPSSGTIRQSLNQAILSELRSAYLEAVAQFEETLVGENATTLTLRRTLVWFEGIRHKIEFILEILKKATDLHGCALISHVHQYHGFGDPDLAGIANRILVLILQPFFATLSHFVFYGTLKDPYHEFFIKENVQTSTEQRSVQWSDYYYIDESQLPSVLSLEVAKKALLAGKTRAFIANLHREDASTSSSSGMAMAMDVDVDVDDEAAADQVSLIANEAEATSVVNREYGRACEQLSRLLWEHYRLREHFCAIRNFVHFGRGDFASSLIELISGPLSKPAGSLFRHALISCLDQALLEICRDESMVDTRDRMDVRLHETTNPKVTGWDVFTLDYKITFPLDVILTKELMTEHVKVSHFLWSLRRVHFVLNGCWARIMQLRRMLRSHPEAGMDLKRLQLFITEGSIVARQSCDYSLAIVHKCWERFFAKLEAPAARTSGLDYFIELHRSLLADLKGSLFVFYHSALRSRLAAVLSALLRAEGTIKGFERYASLWLEHARRQSEAGVPRFRPSSLGGVHPDDESILDTFPAHQLRLLSEHRAAFQHAVRQFQVDLDDLVLQLQKESTTLPTADLLLLLDHNRYHARRNGFDHRKYCAVAK